MARVLLAGDVAPFIHKTALCLAEAGHRVDVLTQGRAGVSLRLSRHIHAVRRVSGPVLWGEEPGLGAAIGEIAAEFGSDVVFPTDVSSTRAWLGSSERPPIAVVPLPSRDALETCDDKVRFARAVESAGLPQPHGWRVIESEQDVPEDDRYPRMVKPATGGGGVGVVRVDSATALREYVTASHARPLLVQDFVPGADIDLSFLALDGRPLAWSIQQRASLDDHDMSFVDHPGVRDICEALIGALGYDGLGHVDLRIDHRDGSVRIVELNPRVWGSVQYSMWMGMNFPALAVAAALGRPVEGRLDPPIGRCVNVGLSARGILGRMWGVDVAPKTLELAAQRSHTTNHGDPLPFIAQKSMVVARRAFQRFEDLASRNN